MIILTIVSISIAATMLSFNLESGRGRLESSILSTGTFMFLLLWGLISFV